MSLLIVGDVAGQFDALMRLSRHGVGRQIVLVGDLVDRGPKSMEVVDWAMNTQNVTALKGNHEDMMVDFFKGSPEYKDPSIWLWNGGGATLRSYGCHLPPQEGWDEAEGDNSLRVSVSETLKAHLKWLEERQLYFHYQETEDDQWVLVTHAPIPGRATLDSALRVSTFQEKTNSSVLWNRYPPSRKSYFQVYGHNSTARTHTDDAGVFAQCIDDSKNGVLMGYLWPEMKLVQEPYLTMDPPRPSELRVAEED